MITNSNASFVSVRSSANEKTLVECDFASLCERLIEERDRLERHLASLANATRAQPGRLADQLDAAAREEERERGFSLTNRERRQLAEVRRALGKFESGTYGICEATGRPIGLERLRACPWARYAIEFQELRDSRQRQGGRRH